MIDKLEFLVALAREQHFGRAAKSCGVAQPTFSQGVQQLEDMLDVPLVKRSSRFLGFTPEGERVLEWARRMVGDAQAMRLEIQQMQQGLGPNVRSRRCRRPCPSSHRSRLPSRFDIPPSGSR
jgi:DNA-binding transcriptional LysR family regulator